MGQLPCQRYRAADNHSPESSRAIPVHQPNGSAEDDEKPRNLQARIVPLPHPPIVRLPDWQE